MSKLVVMPKLVVAGLMALFITASSAAHAQSSDADGSQTLMSEADFKAFTDWRIDVIKTALELTASQTKYWPALEEAIRARANARHLRLAKLAARQKEERELEPFELLRARANALAQRGAGLKRLVDAWQPLYETLDVRQKLRLRFVAAYVLREMSNAIEGRRQQAEEELYENY